MASRSHKAQHRREGGGISMFPFLAVLICTMGALILLLIIITHQAAAQAKREAVEQHSQRKVDLAEQREDAAWRSEILKDSLQKTREKLGEMRQKLGHLENDTSRLRGEVIELAKTRKRLEEQKPTLENSAELKRQLDRLQEKIVTARRKLGEEMRKATGKGKARSFAVVPYQGPNETRRQPIYIECRSDGVVLQPEGIRLGESDFEGFFGPDNPLAAALRAKAGYLQQKYQFSKKMGTPYPLILVRQSGIESYCAAMDAMKSWDSEFGYELIEDDMNLDFTEPDERLKQIVQREIEYARSKKQALAKAIPLLYNNPALARGNGGKQYYAVSSGRGGVVPYNGNTEDLEAANLRGSTSRGSTLRGSSRVSDYRSGRGQYGAGGAGTAAGSYPPVTSSDSPSNLLGSGLDRSGQQNYGQQNYGQQNYGQQNYGQGNYRQGGSIDPGKNTIARSGVASPGSGKGGAKTPYSQREAPRLLTPQGAGVGGYYGQGYNPSQAKNQRESGSVAGLDGSGLDGSGLDGSGLDGSGQGASGQSNDSRRQGPSQGQDYSQGQGQDPSQWPEAPMPREFGQRSSSHGSSSGSATSGGSSSSNGGSPGQSSSNGGQSSSNGAPAPLSMGAPGDPNSPMAGQNVQAPLGIGEWRPKSGNPSSAATPREPRAPDPFAPAHRQRPERPQSIAKERGKDWCLPKESAYHVPLSRPIAIDCYADRFTFRPTRGGLGASTVQLGNRTGDSVNEFVSAVWDRVESWGMAGQEMYWRPVLSIHVSPGGEARFADLQALFQESGFAVERKK